MNAPETAAWIAENLTRLTATKREVSKQKLYGEQLKTLELERIGDALTVIAVILAAQFPART